MGVKLKSLDKAYGLLISGDTFIMSRPSPRTGAERYCIFSKDLTPLLVISSARFRLMSDVLVQKGNKWYLSKRGVRSLHGNSFFKKKYLTNYNSNEQ